MERRNEAARRMEEREAIRRRRTGTTVLWIVIAAITFIGVVLAFWASLASDVASARAAMAASEPAEGIGRESAAEAQRYAGGEEAARCGTALRVYCETDDPLPEWWDPEGAEIVYQATCNVLASKSQVSCNTQPTHSDALDYNLNTTLWGWDGHGAEAWELELFAKCFYLEFWGASETCCEAGCDAMLNLWASGLYGRTLGESLSAANDFGAYVYSVYPNVWTANYDPDGLAWCREFCESRFCEGPKWEAMYFQLYGFHDQSWAIPLYEIDGVYFSMGR